MEQVRLWGHGWPDVEKGGRVGRKQTPWVEESQPPGAAGSRRASTGLSPDPWRQAREAGAPCLVPRGVVSSPPSS